MLMMLMVMLTMKTLLLTMMIMMMVMMTVMMVWSRTGCTGRDAPGTVMALDRVGDGSRVRHGDADCDDEQST